VGTLFIFLSCSRRGDVTLDVVRDTHAHLTLGLNFGIARGLATFRTRFLDKLSKATFFKGNTIIQILTKNMNNVV